MQPPAQQEFQNPILPGPDWLRHAVIAEIPIRAFNLKNYNDTSSWGNKYGDASYESVVDKLQFLNKMGINTICLYSIYHHTPGTNLYAIRHHEASSDLGTLEDIKALVDAAHELEMHVISNTNHYGCDQSSPMISEHPDWFLPEEIDLYGQRVFDLRNPEVIMYIIDTHTWWCTDIGLDGWRIDIAHETYRKYIWDSVLQKCYDSGKQILLATEGAHLEGHIRGAGWGSFPVSSDISNVQKGWNGFEVPYGTLKGYKNSTAEDPYRVKDISSHNSKVPYPYNYDTAKYSREGAYQIKGSNFLFAHNLMFAPLVPWMMFGELINATHLAVPGVMDHKLRGKLLHAYIDWDDLAAHEEVIKDFGKIAKIRQDYPEIIHNSLYESQLINIPHTSADTTNVVPYARFNYGKTAIIIVGNNKTEKNVTFELNIPVKEFGFKRNQQFAITDAWTGIKTLTSARKLSKYIVEVPRDKSPGGGLRVLLITHN
jgi:hypothetical protein